MPLLLLRGFFAGWVVNDKGEWFLRPLSLWLMSQFLTGKLPPFQAATQKKKKKKKAQASPT